MLISHISETTLNKIQKAGQKLEEILSINNDIKRTVLSYEDRIIIYTLLRILAFTNFVLLFSADTTYSALCNISDTLLDNNDLLIEIKEAVDRLLVPLSIKSYWSNQSNKYNKYLCKL